MERGVGGSLEGKSYLFYTHPFFHNGIFVFIRLELWDGVNIKEWSEGVGGGWVNVEKEGEEEEKSR